MKATRLVMGMPAKVEITDAKARSEDIEKVFAYFEEVDTRFSTYKDTSEISSINAGALSKSEWSKDMQVIMDLAEKTKQQTDGYFNIEHDGKLDPSGVVKGWAILQAADLLSDLGYHNYYVEIAGDIQVAGKNQEGEPWVIGIRNPLAHDEIVKVVQLSDQGIATSGTAARGKHIYNPHLPANPENSIVSLTVIGPDVLEADRFATAAFAMGETGIHFIASQPNLEAYAIDRHGQATFTNGFNNYTIAS